MRLTDITKKFFFLKLV